MEKGKGYLLLAFSLAGTSAVTATVAARELGTFSLTFFSLLAALLLPVLGKGKAMVRSVKQMNWPMKKLLFWQTLFGTVLFRLFLTASLQFTSAAEAGVLTGMAPAFTALLAWLILRERQPKSAIMALLVMLVGMLVLQGENLGEISYRVFHWWGYGLALLAALSEGMFNVLSRKMQGSQSAAPDPLVHCGLVALLAAGLCFPLALAEWMVGEFALSDISAACWLAILWYGVVVTTGAFTCMFYGAKTCSGMTIAVFSGVMPITALVSSILLTRTIPAVNQFAGCVLVVLGIIWLAVIDGKD